MTEPIQKDVQIIASSYLSKFSQSQDNEPYFNFEISRGAYDVDVRAA